MRETEGLPNELWERAGAIRKKLLKEVTFEPDFE